ncbi:multiple epidermal growth factor-like domains 10 [Plakobranchus ocellatus]|uniref:Multiple epidermal growth factor-like domains 10 n=1 Tax=Plakobranchus ocellatus TaxID=259542 RepID=A0AAV3ZNF9_9GAST|nr:multiple epidermal growth factor-like domains 10 [Plakobranchus ocellatus]
MGTAVSAFTISSSETPQSDLSWLSDSADTTCNTNDTVQNITVALTTPHPLTWLRVMVNESAYLDQYVLSYQIKGSNATTPCDDPRSARVNDKTLDISCPTSVVVSHVTISGVSVTRLCSLYISGGRNVALKQTADQLETLEDWFARNAVDGDPGIPDNEASLRSTCSHTKPGIGDPAYWRVIFSMDVDINRFIIYNRREPGRGDCCESRLVNFTLEAFPSPAENRQYTYTDPGGPAQQVYTVVPSPHIGFPVNTIYILVRKNRQNDIITLCEFYAFGEVICALGKYGRQCERDCNCFNQTEACFVSTGGCPSGCAAGYTGEDCYTTCPDGTYGSGCNKICSANCAQSTNVCNRVDGVCNGGCTPGFQRPLCTKMCSPGTFGLGCLQNCSVTCAGPDNACHPVNGACELGCDAGYKNRTAQCSETCDPGTYGRNCNETCSDYCAGELNSCDSKNGVCDQGCDIGYLLPLCRNECPSTTFGRDCTETCNTTCANRECHRVTGECLACPDGYTGDTCEQECPSSKFGRDCANGCDTRCLNGECHHVTGECEGCADGYTGFSCEQALPQQEDSSGSGDFVIGLIIGLCSAVGAVVVVVVVILVIFYWRRRTPRHKPGDQEVQGDGYELPLTGGSHDTARPNEGRTSEKQPAKGEQQTPAKILTKMERKDDSTDNNSENTAVKTAVNQYDTAVDQNAAAVNPYETAVDQNAAAVNQYETSINPYATAGDHYESAASLSAKFETPSPITRRRRSYASADETDEQTSEAAAGDDKARVHAYQNEGFTGAM